MSNIIAAADTWFRPNVSTIKRATITQINLSLDAVTDYTDSWDASQNTDGSVMVYVKDTVLTIVTVGGTTLTANQDASNMFSHSGSTDYFSKLVSINNASLIDFSNTTNAYKLCNKCSVLKTIDTSGWDFSNCEDLACAFQTCSALTEVNSTNWNVSSKCTALRLIFSKCTALEHVDVSKWDVSNVEELRGLFQDCTSLLELDVSNWNVSKANTLRLLFARCSSLTKLDVSNWDVSNVEDLSSTFNGCTSLLELDVSNWNVSKANTLRCFLQQGTNGNPSCSITELDLSKWDVSNVEDFSYCFYGMVNLNKISLSNWNTSKGKYFRHIFTHCKSLRDFDCSNWDMSNAETIDGFFHSTKKAVYDISKWNLSNCITIAQLFERCFAANKIIGLENLNTSKCKKMQEMFYLCDKIESLDLSNFDMSSLSDSWVDPDVGTAENATTNMFGGMNKLKEIKFGEKCIIKPNMNLPTPNSTYISEADGYWYTPQGEPYLTANIPSNVAQTYLAISPELLIKSSTLNKLSLAIKSVFNVEEKQTPIDMANNIVNGSLEILDIANLIGGVE